MDKKEPFIVALLYSLQIRIVSAKSYLVQASGSVYGLSNNSVNTIYKDRDGFMWFEYATTGPEPAMTDILSRSTSMPRMSRDLYRIITLPILWKCLTDFVLDKYRPG